MVIDFSDQIKGMGDDSEEKTLKVDPMDQQRESIDISTRIIKALEGKVIDYNKENPDRNLNLHQLRSVYTRSARVICEKSFPDKTKNQWGLARVNMFIHADSPIKKSSSLSQLNEIQLECSEDYISLAKSLSGLDISFDWIPSEEMFLKADEDIEKYDLDIDFDSIDNLYLDDPVSSSYWLED